MFDVIVIGGGVNGTGTARDCAMRGLCTLLLEKRDFGVGATGNSSGMIHGGLRYLLSDATVTRKSCQDSGYIQRIAPHLLFRIPLMVPTPGRGLRAWWSLELTEAYLETYDRFVHLKNGKPHVRLKRDEARTLVPSLIEGIAGAVTTDEWGIDPYRLCVANALSAARHGAQVRLGAEVTGFLRGKDGAVAGVRVGAEEIAARTVVNATGPWLMKLARVAGVQARIRPAKGVHVVLDRRIAPVGVVASAIDGRQIFVLPYDDVSLIGTTDDDYYGNLDRIPILADEVEYLLQGIERVLPDIRRYRRIRATAGIRPTIDRWGVNEDDLSRDHLILDHARRDRTPGLFTVLGGKLAEYRLMSEEATDAVCGAVGRAAPCRTHIEPLPGGEARYDVADGARRYGWPRHTVARLVARHGTRAEHIMSIGKELPGSERLLCDCETVTEAEVRYVVREEWARTPGDVARRTRLGMGPCAGQRCAFAAACAIADERGLDGWAAGDLVREFEAEMAPWRIDAAAV